MYCLETCTGLHWPNEPVQLKWTSSLYSWGGAPPIPYYLIPMQLTFVMSPLSKATPMSRIMTRPSSFPHHQIWPETCPEFIPYSTSSSMPHHYVMPHLHPLWTCSIHSLAFVMKIPAHITHKTAPHALHSTIAPSFRPKCHEVMSLALDTPQNHSIADGTLRTFNLGPRIMSHYYRDTRRHFTVS